MQDWFNGNKNKPRKEKKKREGEGTTSRIRNFLSKVAPGVLLITHDFRSFGPRATVDVVLSAMVKNEDLVRCAWGMFYKPCTALNGGTPPTIQEIIEKKAAAFKRNIFTDGKHALTELTKQTDRIRKPKFTKDALKQQVEDQQFEFATDGNTTSFSIYKSIRISFKHCAARKIELGDSPLGLLVRGLWNMPPNLCDNELKMKILDQIGAKNRRKLKATPDLLPARLADWVVFGHPSPKHLLEHQVSKPTQATSLFDLIDFLLNETGGACPINS